MSEIWGCADFSSAPDVDWVGRAASAAGSRSPLESKAARLGAYCVLGSVDQQIEGPVVSSLSYPHLAITADSRLYNREELRRSLGLDERAGHNDSALLLAAYEKWGEACGNALSGEFAFAIWDERQNSLFCCRDHMGSRPFFYWKKDSRFLFASDRRSILAAPGVRRELNHRKFSGVEVLGGHHFYPQDTFHAGILSLRPASGLTIDRDRIRQNVYWEPRIRKDLVPRQPEDAYEALRELLIQTVKSRMAGYTFPAVYLSGGLDSAAVMSIATRCMEERGQSLLALSATVPDDKLGQFADEREFAEEYRSNSSVRFEYVTAPGAGPFDSIHDPGRFAMSGNWNRTLYLHDALERAAVAGGAQVVFQGLLGELGPTCWANTYYAELAFKCRWPTLMRELRALHDVEGINPVRFLAGRFRDLLPVFPGRALPPAVLLAPDYKRTGKAQKYLRCPWPDQRLHQAALIRAAAKGGYAGEGWTPGRHLRVIQPWLDPRVIEFCLSAPPSLKVRDGYRRYLVRGALEGILPKKVQWRTTKTVFSPDYIARYNAQLEKARDFVAEIGTNDPVRSIIDVAHLGRLLMPLVPGGAQAGSLGRVPSTIYAICFLRQFADYRP